MDELEDLRTDQTIIFFTNMEVEGDGWDPVNLA